MKHGNQKNCTPPRDHDALTLCPVLASWMQQERKLFFEFIKDLEKFELRNGLDHYRVRPSPKARRRNGFGDGDDGTTVMHLGPMLKASIKFYV